jgi:hypothetical protein
MKEAELLFLSGLSHMTRVAVSLKRCCIAALLVDQSFIAFLGFDVDFFAFSDVIFQ